MPRTPLRPIERSASLAEQVYETLRERLRSGAMSWDEPLREVALATQLGVSRTPVREALARLASEGLIRVGGRSFAVPALSEEDIEEIYDMRVLLETEAIRQAGAFADRLVLESNPAVQACRRMRLPADYLYVQRSAVAVSSTGPFSRSREKARSS